MTRSYGKMPRGGAQKPTAPPAEIQIDIAGQHTLEQLALELAKAVARLQDHGVYGVRKVRLRVQPLDKMGKPIALWNEAGESVQSINIPDIPVPPPYRGE